MEGVVKVHELNHTEDILKSLKSNIVCVDQ